MGGVSKIRESAFEECISTLRHAVHRAQQNGIPTKDVGNFLVAYAATLYVETGTPLTDAETYLRKVFAENVRQAEDGEARS